MAGIRKFDEDTVMDAVMRAFWRNGYQATSMVDLSDAAGILRGSLYHAYGGKEELLLKALDRYALNPGGAARAALQSADLRQAIAGFLDSHLARMADPANPAGCLMCQTAMECGARDAVPAGRVREHFRRTETALRNALERGRKARQLSDAADTGGLARYFLGISRGMAVLHRAYGDLDPARDMARIALTVLDDAHSRLGDDATGKAGCPSR